MDCIDDAPMWHKAHDHCTGNRAAIERDGNRAACFRCDRFVSDVCQWRDDAATGVCPRCGDAALVPRTMVVDGRMVVIGTALLHEMHEHWFGAKYADERKQLQDVVAGIL